MSLPALAQPRSKVLAAAFFVALPAIVFYTILFHEALNLPLDDDYGALLDFLNHLTQLGSFPSRAAYFLAAQHNEYKLYFEHALVWLQFDLFGHVDFRLLCAFGNGFVLLLAILLWKMFPPEHRDLATRVALFIPVSWLLFQLEYAETLNWAMAALQNIPVLVFSLGAIYLLVRATGWAYCGALAFLILAVGSSGNGFCLIPVGALILTQGRRYAHLASWFAVSAGCLAAYAYRYNVMSSHADVHHSVLWTILRPKPLYVIAFIGSAGGFPFQWVSFPLGFFICFYFLYMARRGYMRRNPLVSSCVLFLLLSAVGAAGLRSNLGLGHILALRYTIYSLLLLIFAWFATVEEFLLPGSVSPSSNSIFFGVMTAAVLFALCMDFAGWYLLASRHRQLIAGMAAYEHSSTRSSISSPAFQWSDRTVSYDAYKLRVRNILIESARLGIYQSPAFPSLP